MNKKIEQRMVALIEMIMSQGKDNPKLMETLMGSVIVNEANGIWEEVSLEKHLCMSKWCLNKIGGNKIYCKGHENN